MMSTHLFIRHGSCILLSMIFSRSSNIIPIEPSCQKLVRGVASFVLVLLLSFTSQGQAGLGEQCSELFQNETNLQSLPFLLNRSQKPQVHQESLDSLSEVSVELSRRLNSGELNGAKENEARLLVSQIREFDPKSENAGNSIFDIMSRYSILISHGHVANLKDEAIWFEDLFSRYQKRRSKEETIIEVQRLMENSNFEEFRDKILIGLRDIYKTINMKAEKPAIIFSFKDFGISEFILNSDSGYFFVGLSKTNGLSFDNNKNYTALTFLEHDLLHIELAQLWRKIGDNDIEKQDLPNMTARYQDLNILRKLYTNLDKHFSPFEKRFIRASLFIGLHEYGFTPYQFIRRIRMNTEETTKSINAFLTESEVLMRPLKADMVALETNPEKMKILSKILTKFVSLTEAPL